MRLIVIVSCWAGLGAAFPFVAQQEGIKNSHILRRQQVSIDFVLYPAFASVTLSG
jgi:hypothetical protein